MAGAGVGGMLSLLCSQTLLIDTRYREGQRVVGVRCVHAMRALCVSVCVCVLYISNCTLSEVFAPDASVSASSVVMGAKVIPKVPSLFLPSVVVVVVARVRLY